MGLRWNLGKRPNLPEPSLFSCYMGIMITDLYSSFFFLHSFTYLTMIYRLTAMNCASNKHIKTNITNFLFSWSLLGDSNIMKLLFQNSSISTIIEISIGLNCD